MISIETTYGTTQSSLNCEVVLILMLEVYRVIQYFEVVLYRGDLVLHLDTVICMVHLWSLGGCAISVYNMCACLFVSYFEVGGGIRTNFVTFSSAFTRITFMNASTHSVSLAFVFLIHVCTCSEQRD